MNNFTTFYLVRHGQTEWNVERRIQGHKDSYLTEEGKIQASQVAETLKDVHFDAVYSSDLIRAKDTAEIIVQRKNLAVKTTQALREKSQGRLEGRLSREVREELKELWDIYDRLSDEEKMAYKAVPDAESLDEVMSRFLTFMRETAVAYPGKTVLLVTHGGVMRTLLFKLGAATHDQLPSGSVKNTGCIVVESDGIEFRLKEMSGVELRQMQ